MAIYGKRHAVAIAHTAPERANRPLVVTTCSAGKRCRTRLRVDSLEAADQSSMASEWLAMLRAETELTPAGELYHSRAFAIARRAACKAGADLGIISAGLGYVRAERPIPAYDLTVRPSGPGSVPTRVTGAFNAVRWWRAVSDGPFSFPFVDELAGRGLVMVCLSRSYAAMVADTLARFAEEARGALRIFGLSIGSSLPQSLRPFVMPYDERLGAVGADGARVDFAQRALEDFVENALTAGPDLEAQRDAVERRLAFAPPLALRRPQRRADDETIREHIRVAIRDVGPRRSDALAHVRHVREVSCEQGRFARLFLDVTRTMPS